MLNKLIVDIYGWIIEIWLWLILLVSAVAGFHRTVPILKDAGAILENEIAWSVLGAVVTPVAAFLVLAVVFGPILLIVDIRKTVRAIETATRGSASDGNVRPVEYKEPHL